MVKIVKLKLYLKEFYLPKFVKALHKFGSDTQKFDFHSFDVKWSSTFNWRRKTTFLWGKAKFKDIFQFQKLNIHFGQGKNYPVYVPS